ncbi:3'-5' exonuclease [Ferrovibrio sp.]|uniref:3'-5' exonuclease n=1 Tax=Ferrovibrio sp. TaxID=1917215 RepID=UPI00311DC1A1
MLTEQPIPPIAATAGSIAIALDFETASAAPGAVCSAGLAWIGADRRVTHTAHRLVRPHDMRFHPMNVAIHGIRPHDVEFEPEFPGLWDELLPHLEQTPLLLAHNAGFDIGVLRAALKLYGIEPPRLAYLCTVKIARAQWPDLPDHRLPTVAGHLGLELRHHAADSDAAACAGIALAAMAAQEKATLDESLPALGIRPGRLETGYHEPCSSSPERRAAFRRHRLPPWLR